MDLRLTPWVCVCMCLCVVRDRGRSGHTDTFRYPTSLCVARRRNCTLSCLTQKQHRARSRCLSAEPTVCVRVCQCECACARWSPVGPPWRPKPPAFSTANAAKVRRLLCVGGPHLPVVRLCCCCRRCRHSGSPLNVLAGGSESAALICQR